MMIRQLSRSALLEVPVELAYQVVVDVERYPEFVPGCDAVEVRKRSADGLEAKVRVSGMGLRESFVTRNRHEASRITMQLQEGPLKALHGVWHFSQIGDIGCRVEVDIQFELDGLIGRVFSPVAERAANKLVDAFTERMEDLATGALC